jgi:hypothetical protein
MPLSVSDRKFCRFLKLGEFMVTKSISERGQALVIIALAIIGLVGITGLAIDGSSILADRRHAQNAADTSALAGALAKVKPQTDADGNVIPWDLVALDRAKANGYTGDLVRSIVEVYTCDDPDASCAAPYAGHNDYVQVVITSYVDTLFARVLGISKLTNRVQAVALAHPDLSGSLFGGAGVVALNPTCPNNGSLNLGGTGNVYINGGGMFSNSAGDCAVFCNSNSVDVYVCDGYDASGNCIPGTINTPPGGVNGGFDLSDSCSANMVANQGDSGTPFDYHDDVPDLPEPPECQNISANWPTQTIESRLDPVLGTNVDASVITPGYYDSFPPKKVNGADVKDTIFLKPGIYCVDAVLKQTIDHVHIFGDDVTIWVRAGNNITINGGVVQLRATSGAGAPYSPWGTDNAAYVGYLIIAEPDYEGAVTSCVIDGNSTNIYEGAIFAPHCNVTVNGTSDTPPDGINSQIIGYNVTINGGSNLYINYNSDQNPYITDYPKTGITK